MAEEGGKGRKGRGKSGGGDRRGGCGVAVVAVWLEPFFVSTMQERRAKSGEEYTTNTKNSKNMKNTKNMKGDVGSSSCSLLLCQPNARRYVLESRAIVEAEMGEVATKGCAQLA